MVASSRMTPEQYLAFERSCDEKHEYADGAIFAMSGASREHELIVGNVVSELRGALRAKPCEVYPSNMRVFIPTTKRYVYPDASVVCGKPELTDERGDTLLNPKVIVEVLSDSTQDYDRGTKFVHYRTIPSFTDYVVVSQKEALVEHHVRQRDGGWLLHELRAGGRLVLATIDVELAVDELYLKVFSAPSP